MTWSESLHVSFMADAGSGACCLHLWEYLCVYLSSLRQKYNGSIQISPFKYSYATSLLFPAHHSLCVSNKVTGVSDHTVYEQDSRAVPGQV